MYSDSYTASVSLVQTASGCTVFHWDNEGAGCGFRTFNNPDDAAQFMYQMQRGIENAKRERGVYCPECELEKCRCCDRCPCCDGCDTNESLQEAEEIGGL